MYQMSTCPRCQAQVQFGERFCGNCGSPLSWQAPPPAAPPGYQGQQQQWGQQAGWGQQPPPQGPQAGWQQPPQWGQPNPYQQNMYGGYNAGPPQKKSSNLIIILVVLILILFTVGGIGLATKGTFSFSSSSSSTDNQYTSSSSPTTTPSSSTSETDSESETDTTSDSTDTGSTTLRTDVTEITAAKLIEDYNAGDTYAGSIYAGKYYNITGIIKGYSTATTPIWISLVGAAEDTLRVECRFALSTDKSAIGSLTMGESITIQGKVNSYDLSEGAIIVAQSQIVP